MDELAAETVQNIFHWKISGMNNQSIADRLNAKKVPSPAARKLQSGAKLSLHFRKSDEPPWSAKAVDRILHNEVYIGKLVQGKTRRLDYRSKKKMNVPMRDWVIVDNTHEAIIPAEQFELVQRILETETRRPNDAETVALFAGFLYCGDCGSRLVRRSASYKGKRYIYYQCSGSKQNKGSCTSHNLRDEKLYNVVRNALQMQIQIVMEEAEFVESIRQAQQEPYRVRRIERQIRQLTAEKAHTQGIKEKLYGDYYLPALKLPRTRSIGRWGMLHKAYLKLRKPAYYQSLLLSGKLDTVLANVEEQAVERYEVLIEQLSRREDVSEKLKEENQIEWVRHMRNLENRAAEIVKAELIYTFERR